jgi:hypothetical protein
MMIVTIALAFVTATTAGIWGLKRNNISGAKEITEAAVMLVTPQLDKIIELNEAIQSLSKTVGILKIQVGTLEVYVASLSEQIISLGHTPIEIGAK